REKGPHESDRRTRQLPYAQRCLPQECESNCGQETHKHQPPQCSASRNLCVTHVSSWLHLAGLFQGACFAEQFLFAGHALPRGFFGRPTTVPMGFEAHRSAIAVVGERLELLDELYCSLAHGRPGKFSVGFVYDIFQMNVADAIFWKLRVAV